MNIKNISRLILFFSLSCGAKADEDFVYTGSMSTARNSHTATLLPNGRVLVAGGYGPDGTTAISSAELYDPDTGTWTNTGSLNSARQNVSVLQHCRFVI